MKTISDYFIINSDCKCLGEPVGQMPLALSKSPKFVLYCHRICGKNNINVINRTTVSIQF